MSPERFDFVVALYGVCAEHHSGQWSRGYRIMSRISSHYRPRDIPCGLNELFKRRREWSEALRIYISLARKYGDKL